MSSRYGLHRLGLKMTADQSRLGPFLNSLEGEIVAIVPNATPGFFWAPRIDFVLVVKVAAYCLALALWSLA